MISRAVIFGWALLTGFVSAEAARPDLMRFINGDQLHGTFGGISANGGTVWQRDDVEQPVEFKSEQIRQVLLNGGRPIKSLPSLSSLTLVNGDRIPGNVTGLDEEFVTIETGFAGVLKIPRDQIGMVAPNPFGGRMLYHGPYLEEEWSMIHLDALDGLAPEPVAEKPVDPDAERDDAKSDRWEFSGSAWYWRDGKAGTALIRKDGMPDRSILSFNLAWKSRLSLALGFHADFLRPRDPVGDPIPANARGRFVGGDASAFPTLFGSSYVLHFYMNSVMLYRCGFDAEGKSTAEHVRTTSYLTPFNELDRASVELRSNRISGEISLFVNGQFVIQWSEGAGREDAAGYAGKGAGFGFVVPSEKASVRISEMVLAEWNGMPDSARSLQVDEQDIILMANGTDRFSGKVTSIKEDEVMMEGKYGAFRFPVNDVAEIRFAKAGLVKPQEISSDEMLIRLHPIGRISGKPVSGDKTGLRILTKFAGELNVNLESAVMLDFNPSTNFLNDWDVQF